MSQIYKLLHTIETYIIIMIIIQTSSKLWYDENPARNRLSQKMQEEITHSSLIICFISKLYIKSKSCHRRSKMLLADNLLTHPQKEKVRFHF